MVGYVLAQGQILLLALDVQNTREDTNFKMHMFWYTDFMGSLFYITTILPFGLFFSETDESKDYVSIPLPSSKALIMTECD